MINKILESTLFTNIIAIFAISTTFIIYYFHKRNSLKQAATILLLETRIAEKGISIIKNTKNVEENIDILPNNSWPKYRHLFVNKVDEDELEQINNFFVTAQRLETEKQRIYSFFPIAMAEKSKKLQNMLIDIAQNISSEAYNNKTYEDVRDNILKIAHNETYNFLPHAPKTKFFDDLQNIAFITTTTAGKKLKEIAK